MLKEEEARWFTYMQETEAPLEVRPLGSSTDFTSIYYRTRDGKVFSVCLYMNETNNLFAEGTDTW